MMFQNSQHSKLSKQYCMVHPCIIDGQKTLIYQRGLKQANLLSYNAIKHYADQNGYSIKEDRRADFIEGVKRVKEPSRAVVISVLILLASILSQNLSAGEFSNYLGMTQSVSQQVEEMQVYQRIDLDTLSINDTDKLMQGLVQWVNEHSSFNHDTHKIPGLIFSNAEEIAEVAFGGNLPGNIDAKDLNILGLYNFNEHNIYMLDTVDLATPEGKAVLLHEIVHYLQYEKSINENVECMNELEALAYTLEAKYLHAMKVDHDISQTHIERVSDCK